MNPTSTAQYSSGDVTTDGTEPGGPTCVPCRGGGVSPDGRRCWACDGTGDPDGYDRCEHSTEQIGDREYRCWKCGADQTVMEAEQERAEPSGHDTTVVQGVALWWAQCTCGWIAAARSSESAADRDLAIHRSWVENDPGTLDRFGRP